MCFKASAIAGRGVSAWTKARSPALLVKSGIGSLREMTLGQMAKEAPYRVAMLLIVGITVACLGQLSVCPAKDPPRRQTTEGREFEAAFDKYVHDDSIVGAAYVSVNEGQ